MSESRGPGSVGPDPAQPSDDRTSQPADQTAPSGVDQPEAEPDPAERAARANRSTRGAMAGILCLEALVVLLVPRAIRFTTGLGGLRTGILIGLAVILVLAAMLLRRPWGIAVGSLLQVAFILTGFFLGALFGVGAVFAGIWLYLLNLRHELVGTPGGLRMLIS